MTSAIIETNGDVAGFPETAIKTKLNQKSRRCPKATHNRAQHDDNREHGALLFAKTDFQDYLCFRITILAD